MEHYPEQLRILLAAPRLRSRWGQGQAAACRSWVPQRPRSGRLLLRQRERHHRGGHGGLPQYRRHPGEAKATRAGGVQPGVRREEAQGPHPGGSGAFGNAATRIEAFVAAGGTHVYGSYPDIDGLFQEQAVELDQKRRETILHRIQQLIHERVLFAPIWVVAGLSGVGPRVEEPGIGVIPGYAFSAPYEDVKLKVR